MHHLLTFSCKLTDSEKWHPICSESKYGTHYLIYARFEIDTNSDTEKKEVKKIELHLQNYTGAVTLGIASASIPEWGETADGASEMYILKVKIKALFYNPSFDIIVPKGALILGEKDEMETIVNVVENCNINILDNTNQTTKNRARFVDEEFYIRDGEEIKKLENDRGPRNCRAIRSTFYL